MIQPKTKIQSALSRVSAHEYSYVNRRSDVQYPILNGAQTGSTLYLYGHRVYTYAWTYSTLCRINVYTHACYVSWLLTYGRVAMDTCMQRDPRLQRSIFNLFQSYTDEIYCFARFAWLANIWNTRSGENIFRVGDERAIRLRRVQTLVCLVIYFPLEIWNNVFCRNHHHLQQLKGWFY